MSRNADKNRRMTLNETKRKSSFVYNSGMATTMDSDNNDTANRYDIIVELPQQEHLWPTITQHTDIKKVYRIGKKIGSGHDSIVRFAQNRKTGEQRAIKVISRKNMNEETL